MVSIEVAKVRIDGGTQPRASLNESVVAEYAEAMTEGSVLPPVTLFHDGAVYWLADGFHRYHAHRKIGALKIDADVRPGTRRDAVLWSVGANSGHGLPRSNADKRKAVQVLLDDAEWVKWSDREIARQCHVSQPFVGSLRPVTENVFSEKSSPAEKPVDQSSLDSESSEKPAERTYKTKHGTTATMKTGGVSESNKKRAKEKPAETTTATPLEKHDETPGPVQATKPAEPAEVEKLRADLESATEFVAEQGANLQTLLDEVIELRKVCEADDKLTAAAAVIKQKTAENRVLREQLNGAMATAAEAQRMAKSWRAKHDKLARETERARSV